MKIIFTLIMSLYLVGCVSIAHQSEQTLSEMYLQGKAAYQNKDYKLARTSFEHIIKQQPHNKEVLFLLANISMHQHDWVHAMQYYTTLLKLKPSHTRAHHNLAMLYLLQAKKHIHYYIANIPSVDNKGLNELIVSIDNYSKPTTSYEVELDQFLDQITSY
jgi:Tfp pilus assembly protein PilF